MKNNIENSELDFIEFLVLLSNSEEVIHAVTRVNSERNYQQMNFEFTQLMVYFDALSQRIRKEKPEVYLTRGTVGESDPSSEEERAEAEEMEKKGDSAQMAKADKAMHAL